MSGFVFLTDDDGEPIDFVGPYWGEVLGSVFLEDDDGELIDFGGPYGPIDGEFINAVLPPQNTTAYEYSVAEGASDLLPVNIREVVNPTTTPLAFLPFLAAHESVDLWFSDWATSRKEAMIAEAQTLAAKKGTRAGTIRFLSYVDGTLLDAISYPAPFVMGRAVINRTPVAHPPFVARYLVKIVTFKRQRSFVMGRGRIGRTPIKDPSYEKFRRGLTALRAAKAPGTEYRVDFAHKRLITLADGVPVDGTYALGSYVDRFKL